MKTALPPLSLLVLILVLACRGRESSPKQDVVASATATLSPAGSAPAASPAPSSTGGAKEQRATVQLYVRLPGAIPPLERSDKFESPLDALLRERKLGEVSGGGSALKPGGGIEYAGLDVNVYDAKTAIPVVIQELRELKAPKGTTVEELRDEGPAIQHHVW
jgi:hypothetical protein